MNPQDQPQQPSNQPQQPNQPQAGQAAPQPGSNPAPYQQEQPQVVYMARPLEPQRQEMSPEIAKKHEDSKRLFPKLNLSEGEYVISSIRRHPIGLFSIWTVCALAILALFGLVTILAAGANGGMGASLEGTSFPVYYLLIPAVLVSVLVFMFGMIATYIYNANHFYLTNESVIQHIQVGLFSLREQTVSLANIEDASYKQDGIIPHLFDYGLIRLSTQGDETTYRFSYASSPRQQLAILNNAVENFKNIRPIG